MFNISSIVAKRFLPLVSSVSRIFRIDKKEEEDLRLLDMRLLFFNCVKLNFESIMTKSIIFMTLFTLQALCEANFKNPNLPHEHLKYYYRNFPEEAKQCYEDQKCPFKHYLNSSKCWGYEYDCEWENQYSIPQCPGDHKGWVSSKFAQKSTFHTQADFGYVQQQLREMKVLCAPFFPMDSSLECSDHLRFCRGRNIMMNFTNLASRKDPIRYKMDVLGAGDIGGYCELQEHLINERADHISPLQSWGPEIRYFTKLNRRPILEGDCDLVVEKPTFIVKIDATVNMYHHFCDFLNLYASLHLNATHADTFSTDVRVLVWESYTYRSAFGDTWRAFTDHPLWDLKTVAGKTVCFRNVVLPLLPRMIFGLYYNTPIVYGCEKSGMFDAFAKHVMHRLEIPRHIRTTKKIIITFLSRNTKFRKILNELELVAALEQNEDYDVRRVIFDGNMPFKKQLEISRTSDVFIGIHGAGLTHLLFLPEWAVLFELYNCEDSNCYFDLARLKGVKYLTWEDDSKLTRVEEEQYKGDAHAKFANYLFDKKEFLKIIEKAEQHVRSHSEFKNSVKQISKIVSHEEL